VKKKKKNDRIEAKFLEVQAAMQGNIAYHECSY
jgi:hypothetical protein